MSNKTMTTTGSVPEPVPLLGQQSFYGAHWSVAGSPDHLADMPNNRPRLWTAEELADYTGIPIRTLADWRTERARKRGLGLPFVALSSHNVRYRDEDVEAFITKRIVGPIDEAGN